MTIDDVRRARVALAYLFEPGSQALAAALDELGLVDTLKRICRGEAASTLVDVAQQRLAGGDPEPVVDALIERTTRLGARIVTPEDDEWPRQLDDLRRVSRETTRVDRDVFPPVCLWVRGAPSLADVTRRSVAVVGARASTPYGNH
ncbi:MAG TPA: DNA-processing protein DprA, partial [Micromonosporaceae bacterium]